MTFEFILKVEVPQFGEQWEGYKQKENMISVFWYETDL